MAGCSVSAYRFNNSGSGGQRLAFCAFATESGQVFIQKTLLKLPFPEHFLHSFIFGSFFEFVFQRFMKNEQLPDIIAECLVWQLTGEEQPLEIMPLG